MIREKHRLIRFVALFDHTYNPYISRTSPEVGVWTWDR